MDISSYLDKRRALVDAELARILDLRSPHFGKLIESMRYSVFAGGKRVRPILALAACEAVGGPARSGADAMPAACALELAHTFTLIHDDLPCMDDDDFRRGVPANHKVFGEAQALLAGCSLLSLAFEIVAGQVRTGAPGERVAEALRIMARTLGWEGVMGGQSIDMESTGRAADEERVRTICRYKTATLISASCAVGAVMGGGDAARIAILSEFGRVIGLAFQVIDDVLNVEGDAQKLGKGAGTDRAAGKTTFAAVLGVSGAKKLAQSLLDEALAQLSSLGPSADPLRALARYIVARDS